VRYQIPEHIALINLTPEGTVCRLQRDGVRQILLNLVLNSSQAMGERAGNITVSADRENQKLLISVCDDGPGFPSDLIERGIRPFVSRREGGSGLGLSTVQRMARAMGGKLEIANRQPNGAIAKISLKHVETP
jgi:two-component system, NtrC family, sensor kinase